MKKILGFTFLLLCIANSSLYAQTYIDKVTVYWTENGVDKDATYNAGEQVTINRDLGSKVDMRVYRSSAASGTVTYQVADINNSRTSTKNWSGTNYYFSDVAGTKDTQLWVTVNTNSGVIRINLINIVVEEPDLSVSNIRVDNTATPRSYEVGQKVNIDIIVYNLGGGDAPSSKVGYYIGKSSGDLTNRFDTDNVSSLEAGFGSNESESYTFKDSDVGTRYFLFKADEDDEIDEATESDNVATYGPFIVNAKPKELSIEVSPTTQLSRKQSESYSYDITVRDQDGNLVNGASIEILDNVISSSQQKTTNNGITTYTSTVPPSKTIGDYSIEFQAHKSGYESSSKVTRNLSVLELPVADNAELLLTGIKQKIEGFIKSPLVNHYNNNKKHLLSLSHGGLPYADFASAEVVIDLDDLLEITEEGKEGWVTVWANISLSGLGASLSIEDYLAGFGLSVYSWDRSLNYDDPLFDPTYSVLSLNAIGLDFDVATIKSNGSLDWTSLSWSPLSTKTIGFGANFLNAKLNAYKIEIQRTQIIDAIIKAIDESINETDNISFDGKFAEKVFLNIFKATYNEIQTVNQNKTRPFTGLDSNISLEDIPFAKPPQITRHIVGSTFPFNSDIRNYFVPNSEKNIFGNPKVAYDLRVAIQTDPLEPKDYYLKVEEIPDGWYVKAVDSFGNVRAIGNRYPLGVIAGNANISTEWIIGNTNGSSEKVAIKFALYQRKFGPFDNDILLDEYDALFVNDQELQQSNPQTPTPSKPLINSLITNKEELNFEWSSFQHGGDGDSQAGFQVRVIDETENDRRVYDTGFISSTNGSSHTYIVGNFNGLDQISGNERISESLKAGHTYHWHVRYRDSGGDWSAWSADTPGQYQTFTIQNIPEPNIVLLYPNSSNFVFEGGDQYQITWSTSNIQGNLKIDLYRNGQFQNEIGKVSSDLSSFLWRIPTNVPDSPNYKIRISSANDPSIFDESDNPFTIFQDIPNEILSLKAMSPISADENFSITISAGSQENPVDDLFQFSGELKYDKDKVEYVTHEILDFMNLSGTPSIVNNEGNLGQVAIGLTQVNGSQGVTGYGDILKITFKPKPDVEDGELTIFTLDNILAKNSNSQEIPFNEPSKTIEFESAIYVWPGDTDLNQIVNQTDVFAIGDCWRNEGPIRANASEDWVAQKATEWQSPSCTYADTDGNGIVNQTDVFAIGTNWKKEVTNNEPIFVGHSSSDFNFTVGLASPELTGLLSDEIKVGEEISISINIGSEIKPIDDLRSVGFVAEFNPEYLEYVDDNQSSFMGTSSEQLYFAIPETEIHSISFGITRKGDINGVSGFGELATISFRVLKEPGIGQVQLLEFKDVLFKNSTGSEITVESKSLILDSVFDKPKLTVFLPDSLVSFSGSEHTIPVSYLNTDNEPFRALEIEFSYDSTKLEFNDVSLSEITNGSTYDFNKIENGNFKVSIASSGEVIDEGILFDLILTTKNGGESEIEIGAAEFDEGRFDVSTLGTKVITSSYLCGDATGDLKVNAMDASHILKHTVEKLIIDDPFRVLASDVTSNGTISAYDASWVLKSEVDDNFILNCGGQQVLAKQKRVIANLEMDYSESVFENDLLTIPLNLNVKSGNPSSFEMTVYVPDNFEYSDFQIISGVTYSMANSKNGELKLTAFISDNASGRIGELKFKSKSVSSDLSFSGDYRIDENPIQSFESEGLTEAPSSITLHQNYPNPFNPSTNITFELPKQSKLRIAVFNMLGQEVAELANGEFKAGSHSVTWEAGQISSGIYIYQLITDQNVITKKMLLIK